MNWSPILTVTAGSVAVAVSLLRRTSALLLETSVSVPSPPRVAMLLQGSRFVSFLLVYGVLFGLAFWVGRRRADRLSPGRVALGCGVVAAGAYLVGSGTVLSVIEVQQGPLVTAALLFGTGVSVGTQLAVVTFAGLTVGMSPTAESA